LLIEWAVYPKFHLNLYVLLGLCLVAHPELGRTLNAMRYAQAAAPLPVLLRDDASVVAPVLIQPFMMAVVCVMYAAAAFRKLNAEFLSGAVIFQTLRFVRVEAARRRYSDTALPGAFVAWLLIGSHSFNEGPRRLQRTCLQLGMVFTVAAEAALPVLLLSDRTRWCGVALGITLHGAFALLFPLTLAHFSLLSVSTYVLFLDPATVSRAVLALAKWIANVALPG